MEALPTLTIGNNVPSVRALGTWELLVAALATALAGCTPATREDASPSLGELATPEKSRPNTVVSAIAFFLLCNETF
jgi:hypothetical protein